MDQVSYIYANPPRCLANFSINPSPTAVGGLDGHYGSLDAFFDLKYSGGADQFFHNWLLLAESRLSKPASIPKSFNASL